MKLNMRSILILLLVLTLHTAVRAQESTTAAQTLEQLRAQLVDVQTREGGLRLRLQQLDEELKPENIERSLAGIGSTKPEELREHRRRQLTIERDGVMAQLKILEASRARLEDAIARADARAYQESASPVSSPPPAEVPASNSATLSRGFMVIPVVTLLVLSVAVLVLILFGRKRLLGK